MTPLCALLLLTCQFHTWTTVASIDLLQPLIDFKENLFQGLFGKSECGCPCREYYVAKCEITYVEQCLHYDRCEHVPVPSVKQVKEIECQKCHKYYESVPVTKYVTECNPVYDEQCSTEYHQHCKVETRCHMIYQTVCSSSSSATAEQAVGYEATPSSGYGEQQLCQSVPRQHCYPETKCHRSPETRCIPVQKESCSKVPQQDYEKQERKQCLPFELSQSDLQGMPHHHPDPCGNAYSAPHQQQSQQPLAPPLPDPVLQYQPDFGRGLFSKRQARPDAGRFLEQRGGRRLPLRAGRVQRPASSRASGKGKTSAIP